jgi:hypothetical protein
MPSMTNEEIKRQRLQFLQKLYDVSKGDSTKRFNISQIGDSLGLDHDTIHASLSICICFFLSCLIVCHISTNSDLLAYYCTIHKSLPKAFKISYAGIQRR